MEFHVWPSFYETTKACTNAKGFPAVDDYYRVVREGPHFRNFPPEVQRQHDTEDRWYQAQRPYYSVYPSIIEPLVRLRLDIDGGAVPAIPLPEFVVRFAKGHELRTGSGRTTGSLLLTEATDEVFGRRLFIFTQFGETKAWLGHPLPDTTVVPVPLRAGITLEAMIEQTAATVPGFAEQQMADVTTLLKLVCSLCLLGDDPEILEPDVKAKDRGKWERTRDPAIVERAVRGGKRGWLVGAKIEVLPHVRRPHMALRWTGPGGATPRIVPVKGSIVHREIVERLPTGRLDAETKPNQE